MTAKTVPRPSAHISCISTDRQTFDFTIKVQLPNACSICEELFTDEKQLGPNRECKFLSQLCSERKNHRVLAPLIENNEEQQQRQQKSERETQLSDLEVLELFLAGSNMQCYRRVCCGCFENVLLQHANKSGSFWLNDDADIVFSCPFCPLAPVVSEENAEMRLFLAQHPLACLFGNERAKEFFQRSLASKTAKEKAENEENAKENDNDNDDDSDGDSYYSYYDSLGEDTEEYRQRMRAREWPRGVIKDMTRLCEIVSKSTAAKFREVMERALVQQYSPTLYCPVTGCSHREFGVSCYGSTFEDIVCNFAAEKPVRMTLSRFVVCPQHGRHCSRCWEAVQTDTVAKHESVCAGLPGRLVLLKEAKDFRCCPFCLSVCVKSDGCSSVTCANCRTQFEWTEQPRINVRIPDSLRKQLRAEEKAKREREEKEAQELAMFHDFKDEEEKEEDVEKKEKAKEKKEMQNKQFALSETVDEPRRRPLWRRVLRLK